MNAGDQARSLELAQLIASVAALFRQHFPDARPNLRPWRDDPQTRAFEDQQTLDLSFHLLRALFPQASLALNDLFTDLNGRLRSFEAFHQILDQLLLLLGRFLSLQSFELAPFVR